MDGAGDDLDMTEPVPASHRRPGKAQVKRPTHVGEPARPRFVDDLRDNFRLVLLSVLAPLVFVVGGLLFAVFDSNASSVQRVGGVAMAFLGLLVLASYLLRFTTVLTGDGWSKSRVRRVARLVLRYSWHTYLALLGAVTVYEFVDWFVHR
jgi:hypothetical protein